MIPNAPSLGVTQASGEGYAEILDKSTFDPITFLENYNTKRDAEIKAEAKAALDRKAKWAQYDLKNLVPNTIYEGNRAEIETAIDDFGKIITEAQMAGKDPDSPELQREFQKYKAQVTLAKSEGDNVEKIVNGYLTEAATNPEKYDPVVFEKFMNGLNEQPTLKARKEYLAKNKPFEEKFDFYAMLPKLLPPETIYENASGVTTTSLSKPQVRSNIENRLTSLALDPTAKNKTAKMLQDGISQGLWKDSEGMIDWFTEAAMPLGKKETRREIGGGGMSINIGDGSQTINDMQFTSISETNDPTLASGLNGVAVSKNGHDVPPVTVQSDTEAGGGLIPFVPVQFYKTKEGFWRVKGKAGKTSGIMTKAEADAEVIANPRGLTTLIDMGGGNYAVQYDTKTISIPLTESNKRILQGHLGGFDVIEFEEKMGKGKKEEKGVATEGGASRFNKK